MVVGSSHANVKVPQANYVKYILDTIQGFGDSIGWIDEDANGKAYSFANIRESILKCADSLHRDGIQSGDVIGVMSHNTPDQRILVLAAIYCGAVVYPCNHLYTQAELTRMFEIKQPDAFIVASQFVDKVNDVKGKVPEDKIYVIGESRTHKTFKQLLDNGSEKCDIMTCDDDTTILLMHSSGTTGTPKLVQVNGYALLASLILAAYVYVTSYAVSVTIVYVVSPMFHLGSIFATHGLLVQGSTHVLASNPTAPSMLQAVQKYKVTNIGALPPLLLEIVNSDVTMDYDVTSLKSVTTGGAPSSEEFKLKLRKKLNNAFVAEGYGQTEAGILTSSNPRSAKNSQGFLVPNTTMKVVDCTTGNDVGADVYGELRFKGPQVISRGYVGNEEANKALFDDDGWLRTGDLGCYDNEGNVYVTGRIKDVIKYKGVQVAPAELEGELHKLPGVADVAVVGVKDEVGYGGEVPKAFIVRNGDVTEDGVTRFLKDRLADYKQLRGGVVFVDKLPKTATGKIQKRKLPKLMGSLLSSRL
uniref:4-coumarate--CoA ligase 1-like n=1 Tax=Ciona intestinalis TaxID=7719 RepID=F6SEQ4_CIOIN